MWGQPGDMVVMGGMGAQGSVRVLQGGVRGWQSCGGGAVFREDEVDGAAFTWSCIQLCQVLGDG